MASPARALWVASNHGVAAPLGAPEPTASPEFMAGDHEIAGVHGPLMSMHRCAVHPVADRSGGRWRTRGGMHYSVGAMRVFLPIIRFSDGLRAAPL